jgi:hypothetical protein
MERQPLERLSEPTGSSSVQAGTEWSENSVNGYKMVTLNKKRG